MTGKQTYPTFSGSNITPAFLSMTTWAKLFYSPLQMHQIVEEANLVPIDRGLNGYKTHIPHHPHPEPQHTLAGGGGAQKRKKSPQRTYCTV